MGGQLNRTQKMTFNSALKSLLLLTDPSLELPQSPNILVSQANLAGTPITQQKPSERVLHLQTIYYTCYKHFLRSSYGAVRVDELSCRQLGWLCQSGPGSSLALSGTAGRNNGL